MPSRSASRRRIRTHAEWKVETHIARALGPDGDLDALAHLGGRLVRERDGQDLAGSRIPGGKQVGDPAREHPGLARACPGDDQQRPAAVLDGLPLRRVEVGDEVHHLSGPLGLALGPPVGRLGIGTALGRGHRRTHHVRCPAGLSGTRSVLRDGLARGWGGEQRTLVSLAVGLPIHGVGRHGRPREAGQQVIREHLWILGARADTAGTHAPRVSGPAPSCGPPTSLRRGSRPRPTSSTCDPSSGP